MKKTLLAALALAMGCGMASQAADTYIILGEGEGMTTATIGGRGSQNVTTTNNENGFTWTFQGSAGWIAEWIPCTNILPTDIDTFNYTLSFEVQTAWDGELKFKMEFQTGFAVEKTLPNNNSLIRDGETWNPVVINIPEWCGDQIKNVTTTQTVCPVFVAGSYNVSEPTTISFRNIIFTPADFSEDTEAPSAPEIVSIIPSSTSAAITVNSTDNKTNALKYEVTVGEKTYVATGMPGTNTLINLNGLLPETEYAYSVVAIDAAENRSTSVTGTFTTGDPLPINSYYYSFIGKTKKGGEDYRDVEFILKVSNTGIGKVTVECTPYYNEDPFEGLAMGAVSVSIGGDWHDFDKSATPWVWESKNAYEWEQTLNGCFLYIAYTENAFRSPDFSYVVGSQNDPIEPTLGNKVPDVPNIDDPQPTDTTYDIPAGEEGWAQIGNDYAPAANWSVYCDPETYYLTITYKPNTTAAASVQVYFPTTNDFSSTMSGNPTEGYTVTIEKSYEEYLGKTIPFTFYCAVPNGLSQTKPINYLVKTGLTGVESVKVTNEGVVEYYNLQGVRVANPENGIYLRRQGSNVTKVLVK